MAATAPLGSRSMVAIVAAPVMALTWLACSSPAADGESCGTGPGCASGRCVGGTCEGSDCKCEGPDCRTRSTCNEGWLCTRGDAVSSSEAIPQCRQQCTGPGTCPSGKACENGVCRDGGEAFALSWTNIPRVAPCRPRVPCEYKVAPSAGVTVDTYTWSFGDAPSVETTEPTTKLTYETAGTYPVAVRAKASSGASAALRTTETLCIGGIGDSCDVLATLCCEGTCVRGLCK